MKNVLFHLTVVAFAFFVNNPMSQAQAGKLIVSAGIGIEPTVFADDATINTPPVSLKVGYQVSPVFSINAFGGYSSATSQSYLISDGQLANITNRQMFLGLRGELRKELSSKFDCYGGGMLGYSMSDIDEMDPLTGNAIDREPLKPSPINPDAPKGKLLYSGFIGTTFYPMNRLGVFAEVGYGVSLLSSGLTVRL